MLSVKGRRKNSKGFGDVVSTLIMFIAVVSVSVGLVIAFKNYVDSTQNALYVQSQLSSNSLKSKISIINVVYESSSNTSVIYVKNVGKTLLYPSQFDLFISPLSNVSSFMTNFSVVNPSNFSQNLTSLSAGNTVAIIKKYPLSSGTYTYKVVTNNGVSDSTSINI